MEGEAGRSPSTTMRTHGRAAGSTLSTSNTARPVSSFSYSPSSTVDFSLPPDSATNASMNPRSSVDSGVSSSSRASVTGRDMRPKTTLSCCLVASENNSPGFLTAFAAASALRLVAGAVVGVGAVASNEAASVFVVDCS